MTSFRQKELNEKLDFFKDFQSNTMTSLIPWVMRTVLFCGSVMVLLGIISWGYHADLDVLLRQRDALKKKIMMVQSRIRTVHTIKNRLVRLQRKTQKAVQRKCRTQFFLEYCKGIGAFLGENTRLQAISMHKDQLKVTGKTYAGKEVVDLGRSLSRLPELSQIELAHFSKRPHGGYEFQFSGHLANNHCQK